MCNLADLKVCFIAGTLGQGGAERQLYYILKALGQGGASLRVLSLTEGEHWEKKIRDLGIPVTWVGQSGSRMLRLGRIIAELRKRPAEVVQSHHFYTNLYAAAAARALGLREVGAIRCDTTIEVREGGRVFGNLSLRVPRVIAANSRTAIKRAVELGVPDASLRFLPNVVDTDQFKPETRCRRDVVRLVSVGRLVEQKKLHRFLDIVARLRRQSRVEINAAIVGEGPQLAQLKQHASELGLLPGVVEFKGPVKDIEAVYREADILVLTSGWEGTPNVLLEAMASGLPVVATRVGGVPEIVRHGETGFLADAEDDDSILEALLTLVHDAPAREAMGRRARAFITANHSPQQLPDYLSDIYQRALA